MRLGLIGYGAIARGLLELLATPGAPAVEGVTVLTRPGRGSVAGELQALFPGVETVETLGGLLASPPGLVIECAGHGAVAEHGAAVLRAGIDLVAVSVGAMADDALRDALRGAASSSGARLILPAGAVGGIDVLSALSAGGDLAVTYRGSKPPRAWAGTPAESVCDLAALKAPVTFFTGTAREAALDYPKNSNVAATLALAGTGLDATRVELVADPAASGSLHSWHARSAVADVRVEIAGRPMPGNPKTSLSTVYSVLREIRNRVGPVVI